MSHPDADAGLVDTLNASLSGRYAIEREIGRGGMATVFLARDVKHNRQVALKVLKPDLGAVLGPERFLAEIEMTARLQHPNLLPLFDSGEADSLLFYVMPFVAGDTLRHRLDREGQLPVDEALRIATGIAGALDYAHRHGVIHRDLKPENILLHEREPLVMDFGIAFAVSTAGGERLTQLGMSLGTPQYMSPEQATGDRQIDARCDVYSLGAVLYEMLVGAPPHTGNTIQAVIAKVIMDRPASVRVTRTLVPEYVDRALDRALAKLPADRFGSAMEFAAALTGEHAVVVRGAASPVAQAYTVRAVSPSVRRPPRQRVAIGAVFGMVLVAAAVGGSVAAVALRPVPVPLHAQFTVEIPDSVVMPAVGRSIALSPDGSALAVAAMVTGQPSRIYTRTMNGVSLSALHGTEGGRSPVYSPDGTSLLFSVDGRMMKVAAAGGAPLPLADSTDGQYSWGEGDAVVFVRRGALWKMSAAGGTALPLARPDSVQGQRAFASPEILPGGKYALITIERTMGTAPDSNHLGVVSMVDGTVKDLDIVGSGGRYAASRVRTAWPPGAAGHVVFATGDGSLWAAPFSVGRRALTGGKTLLASAVHVDATGAADIAVSATGTIVYGERAGASQSARRPVALAIIDSAGTTTASSSQTGNFYSPRVSPGGERIALTVGAGGERTDVWIFEIATGQLTPMTRDGLSHYPEWADAGRVVFRDKSAGLEGRFVSQPWDHSTVPELYLLPGNSIPTLSLSLGPPGGYLAFIKNRIGGGAARHQDIYIAPMAHPEVQSSLLETTASEVSPRVSPNGKWLAYTSNESGAFQLYVVPLPGPGARVPISIDNGIEPVWSRNGRILYYVANMLLMAAHIDERSGFRVTTQDTVLSFRDRGFAVHPAPVRGASLGFYDVMPNGGFVVLTTAAADSSRSGIVAVLNWQHLLKSGAAGPPTP